MLSAIAFSALACENVANAGWPDLERADDRVQPRHAVSPACRANSSSTGTASRDDPLRHGVADQRFERRAVRLDAVRQRIARDLHDAAVQLVGRGRLLDAARGESST